MGKRILYQLPGDPVSIVIPCDCGLTTEQIGRKDVPQDVPFWIVSADEIPDDRSLRAAWTIDTDAMGEPDGYGGIQ